MGGSRPRPAVSPRISKCRMEAVALDGLELLMEPLAKANPTAKVRSEGRWAIGDFGGFFCYFIYLVVLDGFSLAVWIYCTSFFGMKKIMIWYLSGKVQAYHQDVWSLKNFYLRCANNNLWILSERDWRFTAWSSRSRWLCWIGGPFHNGENPWMSSPSNSLQLEMTWLTWWRKIWSWRASNDPRCQVERRRRSPLTFCHGQENLGWNDLTILTALVHNGNLTLLVTFDSCVLDSLPVAPAYSSTTLHVRRRCTIITSTTVVVAVMVIMLIPLLLYLI